MAEDEASDLRGLLGEVQDARDKIEEFRKTNGSIDFLSSDKKLVSEYKSLLAAGRKELTNFWSYLCHRLVLDPLQDFGKEDIEDYRNQETLIDERTREFFAPVLGSLFGDRSFRDAIANRNVLRDIWDSVLEIVPQDRFDVDSYHSILDAIGVVDPYEFLERHRKLRPIFVSAGASKNLLGIARAVAMSYKLGQWPAVLVFCRVLLEDVLKEIDSSERFRPIEIDKDGKKKKGSNPKWLEKVGEKLLAGREEKNFLRLAKDTMRKANKVLHEATFSTFKEGEVLPKLEACFHVAELLLARKKNLRGK